MLLIFLQFQSIKDLLRKGYLHLSGWMGPKQPPFELLIRHHVRSEVYIGEWTISRESEERYTGAWLISGAGDSIAWVPDYEDANYLAGCANAIHKLERNVRRYGGAPNESFPSRLMRGGIFELVNILIRSVYGSERWETNQPPRDLEETGKRLEADLRQFYDGAASFRYGQGARQ